MSDRQKIPPYITALNIVMIVILLAICGLIFALTMASKELGWSLPTADNSTSVSQSAGTQEESDASDTADPQPVTVQASSAE